MEHSHRWHGAAPAALCLAAAAAMAALAAMPRPAYAADAPGAADGAAAPAKARKKPGRKGVKIINSRNHSGETAAERDRRLYRECKGLPNAGACRGYTQR